MMIVRLLVSVCEIGLNGVKHNNWYGIYLGTYSVRCADQQCIRTGARNKTSGCYNSPESEVSIQDACFGYHK